MHMIILIIMSDSSIFRMLVNEKFYEPGDMGYERDIKKHLDKIKSEA